MKKEDLVYLKKWAFEQAVMIHTTNFNTPNKSIPLSGGGTKQTVYDTANKIYDFTLDTDDNKWLKAEDSES